MSTINHVNKELKVLGDIKLVKGKDYFYFVGDDVNVSAESVYVYRLNALTVEQWFEEAKVATKEQEQPAPSGA